MTITVYLCDWIELSEMEGESSQVSAGYTVSGNNFPDEFNNFPLNVFSTGLGTGSQSLPSKEIKLGWADGRHIWNILKLCSIADDLSVKTSTEMH